MKSSVGLLFNFVLVGLVAVTQAELNCDNGCFEFRNESNISCDCCSNNGPLANPCHLTDCPSGQECSLLYKSSIDMEDCKPGAIPLRPYCQLPCEPEEPCILPEIKMYRMYGCPFCKKPDDGFDNPCLKADTCPDKSYSCTLHEVNCIQAPCYPITKCCPKVDCPANCLSYKDDNGCPACHCCNLCVNHPCKNGQKCILEKVYCKRCPCPPRPRCV